MGTKLSINKYNHYESNGKTERTIQIIQNMLQVCILESGGGWNQHLPLIEFSYNNN